MSVSVSVRVRVRVSVSARVSVRVRVRVSVRVRVCVLDVNKTCQNFRILVNMNKTLQICTNCSKYGQKPSKYEQH